MIRRHVHVLPVVLLCLVAFRPAAADEALDAAFPKSSIVIDASDGACYHFDVHVAMNDEQRRRGLMHVRHMDAFRGMLFAYPQAAIHSMWMKNTYIPLDMLFILRDGGISSVARNTEPQSLTSIHSTEPVQFVLELNAGITESLHIAAGDRVLWDGELDDSALSEN